MTVTINGTTGITNDGGYTGDGISFADTTPANTLVTTTSGNVGVGTSSPASKLHVSNGDVRVDTGKSFVCYNPANSRYGSFYTSVDGTEVSSYNGSGEPLILTSPTGDIRYRTNGSERMRIDSSGNLLLGTTDTASGNMIGLAAKSNSASAQALSLWNSATSGTRYLAWFGTGASFTVNGYISSNGTNVTYSTSSDYRLKENIQPMQNALGVVAQLNPVTYTWKADGSDGQGFIAHELQAVVPDCVTGEKDAVDAEGNPVYQGIDTSFLVATLTKAIQELSAKNDALEARLAALEAK